jgi:hypothetical protein
VGLASSILITSHFDFAACREAVSLLNMARPTRAAVADTAPTGGTEGAAGRACSVETSFSRTRTRALRASSCPSESQIARTFWASSPFLPGTASNSTRWPSSRLL